LSREKISVDQEPRYSLRGLDEATPETRQKGFYPEGIPKKPDLSKARMFVNRAVTLAAGKLLLVSQGDNTVYCMDPETGEFEFVFKLYDTQGAFLFRAVATPAGEIFCTVTGARYEHDNRGVIFGSGGGIFRIVPKAELIGLVPRSTDLVDPCGLRLLDNGNLLVTDFDGFTGNNAAIYEIQPTTGKRWTLAQGGNLSIPIGAYMERADRVLYVANAIMQYEYPDDPQNDTGNILRYDLPDPAPRDFVPEAYPPAGSVLGINGAPGEPDLIMVTCGAPMFRVGSLIAVNRKSGETRTLIGASQEKRRFFSPHSDLKDGHVYSADSYQKELLVIEIATGNVKRSLPLSGILGEYKGVKEQFDIVDCVSIIPPQW